MPTIAHPTSAAKLDQPAFLHALAIARARRRDLVLIHVGEAGHEALLPSVTAVLERWGSAGAVEARSIVHPWGEDDPADGVLDALEQVEPELCVLATSRRDGIARALLESRAEAIARHAPCPVLVFPENADPFIDESTGAIELTRIVVPVGDEAAARTGVEEAGKLIDSLGVPHAELLLLHQGGGARPEIQLQSDRTVTWREVTGGSLEDAVDEASAHASLVVMATRGRNSVLDVILGTHTERVVQRSRCPVLEVRVP